MSASTSEARAAIAARRLAGESYAAIGHTYGVSRERIRLPGNTLQTAKGFA